MAKRNNVALEGTVESHSERRKNFKVCLVQVYTVDVGSKVL